MRHTGHQVDIGFLGDMKPSHILFQFDIYSTFIFQGADQHWYLSHSCDDFQCLVSRITKEIADGVIDGAIRVRDALNSPQMWVVDEATSDEPIAAYQVKFDEIPDEYLPTK